MTFDPNDRQNEFRNPELNNTTQVRSGSTWVAWVAVLAVILVGAFVWSQMGGSPATDQQTTSSTNPPVTDNSSPAPAPVPPAAPPASDAAPATPPAGGGAGGTGTQP